jgi:hypothetical protein
VIEAFDASHVDGSDVVVAAIETDTSAKINRWKQKIQDAVWQVNRGLFCNVGVLSEDAYDEFC